jgi:hypothetical protein
MGKRGFSPFLPSRLRVAIVRSVRLFTIPIRAVAHPNSWDEISVRGEGCDTLGGTVAATTL